MYKSFYLASATLALWFWENRSWNDPRQSLQVPLQLANGLPSIFHMQAQFCFFSPLDNMKTQQRISRHRVYFLQQKQKEMPCLRKHLLLEFQGGRAMYKGRAPAKGPGDRAAQGLCPSHTVGLSLPAPDMRPGTETVLN